MGTSFLKSVLIAPLLLTAMTTFRWVWAEVVFDGTVGPAGTRSGNIVIPQAQGATAGNNLFHSFYTFNINNGEHVLFTGPSTISNIISRVTGTSASSIDGVLDHNMPNASFWLLNPNGIIFGQNASLPTHGAFHATTADYLLFEDGGRFGADTSLPQNRVLSVENPSVFGFIGPNPGSITVQNSELIVEDGTGLSLVGGDIEIRGDATQQLVADSGDINLVSIGASGEAAITSQGVDSDAFSQGGTIRLQDSVIHANNALEEPGTSSISIQGGELIVENSEVSANTSAATSDDMGIEIDAKQNITLSASSIHSNSDDMGESVPINLSAEGNILLQNQSAISTSSHSDTDSGDINILAQNLTIESQSTIKTINHAVGNAGDIRISASVVDLDGGWLDASSRGSGASGSVILSDIERLSLIGGGAILAETHASGEGGRIDIEADTIHILMNINTFMVDGVISSGIYTNTWGSGNAGDITLSASELVIQNGRIASDTFLSGHAGNIDINVDSLILSKAGIISSSTWTADAIGNSGSIHINAEDSLTMEGYAEHNGTRIPCLISTGTDTAGGDAGDIRISAPVVDINTGLLNTTSKGSGSSGSVTLSDVERLSLTNGGTIHADTLATGGSGQIDIEADTIYISGTNSPTGNYVLHSGIYTCSSGSGHANNLTLKSENLVLDQGGMLRSSTSSSGNAGNIFIGTSESPVGNLTLLDGSIITTDTTGSGNAGNININAMGAVILQPQSQGAFITSSSTGRDPNALGSAGTIHLNANTLNILSGGAIITNTQSHHGTPANIQITVDDLLMQGENTNTLQVITAIENGQPSQVLATGIASNASANQRGGSIMINATGQVMLRSGIITASGRGVGGGGDIFFGNSASPLGLFIIDENSVIFARAQQGNGGNIFIFPNTFLREVNSRINADSALGNAGMIEIDNLEHDVTDFILDLENTLMGPDLLISQACDVNHVQQQSALTVDGRSGLRLSPGDYIPSKMPWISLEYKQDTHR
jgi:filamentous hemagglutinin family protein